MVEDDIAPGDCVKLPDGRMARVREMRGSIVRVRVRRKTSKTHQFLDLPLKDLIKAPCPKGWMSPEGYNRYLKVTLEKMRLRRSRK